MIAIIYIFICLVFIASLIGRLSDIIYNSFQSGSDAKYFRQLRGFRDGHPVESLASFEVFCKPFDVKLLSVVKRA